MENDDKKPSEEQKNHGSFAGGMALGIGLLFFVKYRAVLRPYLLDGLKELIELKEWLLTQSEDVRSDLEDLLAEAKHRYDKDAASLSALAAKEKELSKKAKDILKESEGPSNA